MMPPIQRRSASIGRTGRPPITMPATKKSPKEKCRALIFPGGYDAQGNRIKSPKKSPKAKRAASKSPKKAKRSASKSPKKSPKKARKANGYAEFVKEVQKTHKPAKGELMNTASKLWKNLSDADKKAWLGH